MAVSAEYHAPSGMAYLQENDSYLTLCCSLRTFVDIVKMFAEHYGKFEYEPIGETGVYVMFGKE